MRSCFLTAIASPSLLLVIAVVGHSSEKLEWRWSKEKATLAYSIKTTLPKDYELANKDELYATIKIRDKRSGKVINLPVKGHDHTVFTRWQDTLFIADYYSHASGCKVVALDLKNGKKLWVTWLKGIGSVLHTEYTNLVNIDTDGKRITVYGNEWQGRYIEQLDIKTGQTLANNKLAPDWNSLR